MPDTLSIHAIRALQKGRARECPLIILDEIDSTNSEATRLLAAGRPAPFAVFARRQIAGRGRFGRAWHSENQGNIYASFAFRPQIPPSHMSTFTLWMGLGVCELIHHFAGLSPGIKWPNDIVFDGRKAGGVLTEARIDADLIHELVFGLGLNVNTSPGDWPADLRRRATSLGEQARAPLDLNRFAAALIGRTLLDYRRFLDGDAPAAFAERWQRYDTLRGRAIAVLQGEQRFAGLAAGIDDEGSLLLRDARGRLRPFRAGEVTIEKES
ncbi:biotin--[acetyl-CoA-carboxylase] ligase [Horticoccus luteus]|uniref:biotin--[acetyl-CoA-carboxylase] ligase n=1 Tax=Horticoccus luteus TaxID=2862869 RepID=UPI0021020453|nr:biotin--[acetyl-CoA-carboxylase] ligase [Horticoccus luteus]